MRRPQLRRVLINLASRLTPQKRMSPGDLGMSVLSTSGSRTSPIFAALSIKPDIARARDLGTPTGSSRECFDAHILLSDLAQANRFTRALSQPSNGMLLCPEYVDRSLKLM
jgi:hypothetical protein